MAVVEVERPEPGIVIITMNRPERLNALNRELTESLARALDDVRRDPECRVVILTGAEGAFSSGADRKSPKDDFLIPGDETRGYVGQVWGSQELVTGIAIALNELRQPVIAAIDGVAVGGGFGFALASDLRIATDRARLGAVFMKIGLSNLDVGVSYFLPRIIGTGRALELMLSARIVDAQAACEMGLVNKVVPADKLRESALELAREIAANSELGVWMTKEGFWSNVDAPSLRHAVKLEYRTQMIGMYGEDRNAAAAAFAEKRPAKWGPA